MLRTGTERGNGLEIIKDNGGKSWNLIIMGRRGYILQNTPPTPTPFGAKIMKR
jgi:hypothetical protein